MKATLDTETTLIPHANGEVVAQAQATPQTYEELANLFVSEQDIKPTSRALYRRTLSLFFEWIKQEKFPLLNAPEALTLINRANLNEYKDSLEARGLSKLTIGSYIVAVRKFYEWCEARGLWINIARNLKTPPKKQAYRKQHLSEEKSKELLQYFRKSRGDKRSGRKSPHLKKLLSPEVLARDYAIVSLMLRTGLRTIEVVRADIGDITYKRERRVLKVYGKGRTDKEEDFVVLTDAALKPIEDYLRKYRKNARRGEPLFTSVSTQNRGSRLSTRSVSGLCKEGLRKIGLKGNEFTAHSLRHTTAVAIIKTTNNVNEVQAVLRHHSIDTSRIYLKSIEEEMRLERPTELKLEKYFK